MQARYQLIFVFSVFSFKLDLLEASSHTSLMTPNQDNLPSNPRQQPGWQLGWQTW